MSNTEKVFIEIGKWQKLKVVSAIDIGVYLGDEENRVLLPRKQVKPGTKVGDEIEVFIYKDSSDRPIATVNKPLITAGETAVLRVKQNTRIGAFLDWGLEKDLLLPFAQQIHPVEEGLFYPVALYVDKSGRLAATMWVDKYITGGDADEKKRKRSLLVLRADAENVYVKIRRKGGYLEYNDRAEPEVIEKDFGLSKNAFKKAVGVLYKERRLVINEDSIQLTE